MTPLDRHPTSADLHSLDSVPLAPLDRPRIDAELRALAHLRRRRTALWTCAMLLAYYGFVCLVAFRRELFGVPLGSGVTLGIPLGLGVIGFTWMASLLYVAWANRVYDREAERLRRKLERP